MSRPPSVTQAERIVDETRAAIAAVQLFERVKGEIAADVAHPDALHLALGRIDTESGKRAFMRAVQKFMEGQHAAH